MSLPELILVPTAGFAPGSFEPSENGKLRLERGAELAKSKRSIFLAIIGCEAIGYRQYFEEKYPDLVRRIAFINNQAKMTNRDIDEASGDILCFFVTKGVANKKEKIGIISYGWHRWRIAWILRSFGYQKANIIHYDSNEKSDRPLWQEMVLSAITIIDPCFVGPLGRLLVRMTQDRRTG
jgi:hypothetical protein